MALESFERQHSLDTDELTDEQRRLARRHILRKHAADADELLAMLGVVEAPEPPAGLRMVLAAVRERLTKNAARGMGPEGLRSLVRREVGDSPGMLAAVEAALARDHRIERRGDKWVRRGA